MVGRVWGCVRHVYFNNVGVWACVSREGVGGV